jgi:DNA-directed RNA polymerase subunit RPC12/RpoP
MSQVAGDALAQAEGRLTCPKCKGRLAQELTTEKCSKCGRELALPIFGTDLWCLQCDEGGSS